MWANKQIYFRLDDIIRPFVLLPFILRSTAAISISTAKQCNVRIADRFPVRKNAVVYFDPNYATIKQNIYNVANVAKICVLLTNHIA